MSELRKAVKLLVKSGIIVDQEAFTMLKQVQDPLGITSSFLSNFPNKSSFTKNDLLNLVKKPIVPGIKVPKSTESKVTKSSSIPRRHRTRLSIKLDQSNTVTNEPDTRNVVFNKNIFRTKFEDLQGLKSFETDFKVIKDPIIKENFKGTIDNLIEYFQSRFNKLSNIFRNRLDIPNLVKIKDLDTRRDEGEVSVIGMIADKRFNSNGGGSLTIEDPVSDRMIQVILPSKDKILVDKCIQIMSDTVICVIGFLKNSNLIAKDVLLPDIPNMRRKHYAEIPAHVAFLSDIHIGSKNFIEKPLDNFIEFINGNYGNKKIRALGEQTKYVMFGGDVVDGVGIYVDHHKDLAVDDIKEQYSIFSNYLERIPEDVQIVIIPGNHDMVRNAEPQPRIQDKHASSLARMENVHLLANPSQVALHNVEVLLYHCTSIPDIMNSIPGVPNDKPVEIMKHMLKARHLAPIWGSKTPIAAEDEDHLVIDRIPDIFQGGHMHINGEGYYKGVQILNSGTMQNQTAFQKSLNIIPTPGQVTVTNLKTHEMNRINFLD